MVVDRSATIRIISLLKLMTQSSGSAAYFANLLRVDERTIRRDVEFLRNAGFPIVADRSTGRLELVSDFGVPAFELTQREALALVVLFQEFGDRYEGALFVAARNAAAKILSSTVPDALEPLGLLRAPVELRPGPVDGKSLVDESSGNSVVGFAPGFDAETRRRQELDDRKFELILDALESKRAIDAKYRGPLKPEIETTLHPYALFFSRAWYVVAHSTLHRDIRTFKISRFTEITDAPDKYRPFPDFSLDEHFGLAWRFVRGYPRRRVVVRFSRLVGQNVAEVRWHKTQISRFFPDGTAELEFEVDGLDEIAWWIMGYGPEAEVVEPPELRRIIVENARRVLERYSTDPIPRWSPAGDRPTWREF